jgi:DNA-binding LacI/PurR family transcriptional regulator
MVLISQPTPQTGPHQGRRDKTTLRDIAAAAGVSVATVSRALSRPEMVSPALKARIEALCLERRYIPNHAARSLTLDRSRALGLVVPTISNPVFSPLIESVQAALEPQGYGLMIHCSRRDPGREFRQCQALIERGVDGIILGNPEHDPALFEMLDTFGMPFLCVGGSAHGADRPAVTYDAGAAISLALDHLLQFGHRDIAVLSGPRATTPVIEDRLATVLSALASRGLTLPDSWCVECGYAAPEALEGARSLLTGRPIPTAILCTGDLHALAALSACRDHGLDVPRDISVIGCNDMAIAQYSTPSLTTVRTPYSEIGTVAAEMMIAMIDEQQVSPFTLLPSQLVERNSVAVPSKAVPPAATVPGASRRKKSKSSRSAR